MDTTNCSTFPVNAVGNLVITHVQMTTDDRDSGYRESIY